MSYVLLEKDTLSEAIENAFDRGRSFQALRDCEAVSVVVNRLQEEYDSEVDEGDIVFPENPRKDGWNHGLHELKNVLDTDFEEDANCCGFIERERTISILTPDSEDIPNVETFQAQAMLADIREILANPEMYGGESLEKLGLIINILCKD